MTYLFQLFNDHGECFKDGGGWTCQSNDPLRTIALRDVDASPTLQTKSRESKELKDEIILRTHWKSANCGLLPIMLHHVVLCHN